jgi:hypothetical protein
MYNIPMNLFKSSVYQLSKLQNKLKYCQPSKLHYIEILIDLVNQKLAYRTLQPEIVPARDSKFLKI